MVTALTAGLLWTQGTVVDAALGLKGNALRELATRRWTHENLNRHGVFEWKSERKTGSDCGR
jgi:hypothetical protein